MHVQEIRLQQVLEGSKQYRVPLYQRTYAWHEKQHSRLWDDIVALADERESEPTATHFTGSLVLATGAVGPGGNEFLVVDGQQRLTTLSVLIAAIRDHVAETEGEHSPSVARLHESFLVDRFKQGDARLKLLPTQADRDAFRGIIDRHLSAGDASGVVATYRYFRHRLHEIDDPDDPHDVDRITGAVLDGLVFVAITAGHGDNVYRIFESLNNTGMKLTQGDLLRNYLFMRLGPRGEATYSSVWLPMQSILSTAELESLFWLDLTWSTPDAKLNNVYALQEARLSRMSVNEIEVEVRRYAALAQLLATIHEPDREPDARIRESLQRLRAWGNSGTDPLVLRLLERRAADAINVDQVADSLHVIESFLVRRLFVNAPSNALSRILLRAAQDMTDEDPAGSLRVYFSTGRKFFASDRQISEALVSKPFYFSGRRHQKKVALSWIEMLIAGKEPAALGAASIEHVMPQTITAAWKGALSADLGDYSTADELHEALVHVAANLTLSGYNSELSNAPFAEKRQLLAKSNIALNAEIAENERWGRTEILRRGTRLAELITSHWTGPVRDAAVPDAGFRWDLVSDVIAAIPPGSWTSYGQVAALAGTHPVPLGVFLASNLVDGAWRVLQAAGTVSPGFRWTADSPHYGYDPMKVLEQEGVTFDEQQRASADRYLDVQALGRLIGISVDEGVLVRESDDDGEREREYLQQLSERSPADTVHGVIDLLSAWRSLGGTVSFGTSTDIGAFLMLPRGERRGIWPFVIYSSGSVEVVFQWLSNRPPFDDRDLRDELRRRLNEVLGVVLPERKIDARPSFSVDVLVDPDQRFAVVDTLEWFVQKVQDFDWGMAIAPEAIEKGGVSITIAGVNRLLSRELVESQLAGVAPAKIDTYWIEIEGTRYPVKQALAAALRVSTREFQSYKARQHLEAIGFEVGQGT